MIYIPYSYVKKAVFVLFCVSLLLLCNIPAVITRTLYGAHRDMLSKQILNGQNGYEKVQSLSADILYTPADVEYVALIIDTVETYYPLILKALEMAAQDKVSIIIYPTKQSLFSALSLEYSAQTPMGIYYGGVLHILSPGQWVKGENEAEQKDYFLHNGPIVHELIHLALDIKTQGNYPRWFSEGVALYYEKNFLEFTWHSKGKATISYEDLTKRFSELDVNNGYRKCYDVIVFITDNYGEDALLGVINILASGKSFKTAFEKQLKIPVSIIDTI